MKIIDGFRLREVMGQATVIGEELAAKDAAAILEKWIEIGLVR